MKTLLDKYRFLIARRISQVLIMVLYVIANVYGINFLTGNLSSSLLAGIIPLSDPYAVLQMFVAGAVISIDIIVGALRRKLGFNQIQKKQPASRNIRYWVLAISLVISFFMGLAAFEFISPISMVHRGIIFGLGFGWAAILVIFLFDLFVLKNGWCGHVCPLGGAYSLIGKTSLIRVHHNAPNCTACMKCKEVCPEVQVLHMVTKESIPVLSGECTNCGRCIEVCDDDALNFSIKNLKKGKDNEVR